MRVYNALYKPTLSAHLHPPPAPHVCVSVCVYLCVSLSAQLGGVEVGWFCEGVEPLALILACIKCAPGGCFPLLFRRYFLCV